MTHLIYLNMVLICIYLVPFMFDGIFEVIVVWSKKCINKYDIKLVDVPKWKEFNVQTVKNAMNSKNFKTTYQIIKSKKYSSK